MLTRRGRLLRLSMLEIPAVLPASANEPNLNGGLPVSELVSLDPGERALALCRSPPTDRAWPWARAAGW